MKLFVQFIVLVARLIVGSIVFIVMMGMIVLLILLAGCSTTVERSDGVKDSIERGVLELSGTGEGQYRPLGWSEYTRKTPLYINIERYGVVRTNVPVRWEDTEIPCPMSVHGETVLLRVWVWGGTDMYLSCPRKIECGYYTWVDEYPIDGGV